MMRAVERRSSAVPIGYKQSKPMTLSAYAIADDIMMFTSKEQDLQEQLKIWDEKVENKHQTSVSI